MTTIKHITVLVALLLTSAGVLAQLPTITNVSPNTGIQGSSVTITGSNFNTTDTNNVVWFGATRAAVTSASGTSLSVTAPTGATYDRITVLNKASNLLRQHVSPYKPTFNGSPYIANTINFNTKVDYNVGSRPTMMAAGDLDGDGRADMVAVNSGSNTISVLRNISSGTGISTGSFAAKVDFATGSTPHGVAIGDIDGDGKLDIVATNTNSNTISVYRNTSTIGSLDSSSFATKVDFSVGESPKECAFGDLDRDGKLDLVVNLLSSSAGTLSVLRNTATSGSITTGSFASAFSLSGYTAGYPLAIGDLDGDGKPEIVAGNNGGLVSVFVNRYTSGSFNSSSFYSPLNFSFGTGTAWGVGIGDLDGDNKPEIVVTDGGTNTISILKNNITTAYYTFATRVTFACGPNPGSVVIADLNGDGKADIANTSYDDYKINVFLNRSSTGSITTSSFAAKVTFNSGASPWGLAACDYDGDGKTDLASINYNGGTISIIRDNPISPIAGAGTICGGTTLQLYDSATNGTWSSSAAGIATVSNTGLVTGISAGTAIITYAGTGAGATDTALITVIASPALSPTSTSVCAGNSTTITMSGAITYSWSPASWLSATTGATVTVSPTVTSVCTVTGTNALGCTTSVPVTVNVMAWPTATVTAAPAPCVGYGTSVVISGPSSGTVAYSANSGATQYGTLTGGTLTIGTGAITAPNNYRLINVDNGYCTSTIDSLFWINPIPVQWTGSVDGDWNNGANWSCGFAPGAADSVIIPGSTAFNPTIAAATTVNVRSLNVQSGSVISNGSGGQLNLTGHLALSGTINGSGIVHMNGSSVQVVSGRGYVSSMDIDNTAGVQIGTASLLTIGKTLFVTSGTLTTNDSLVLNSDSAGTARVATLPSGSSISGNVRVKQYVQGGMRRYRFWSHPFSNYIALNQITDDIDVTGSGGTTNGFTNTASNAPSAYRYNTTRGNSAMGYDPGWAPFTSAYGTVDSNRIHQYQGIRLYFRGNKGEGLGYGSYTPSPVVITQSGALNQGDVTVPLQKGSSANQDYNMVGNPYASPVDIGTVIYNAKEAGAIAGGAFYIWNPSLGAAGQFQAHSISTTAATPYYLPANSAFQVRAAYNGAALNFAETNKHETATAALFRSQPEIVSLAVYDENEHLWDMLHIRFNQQAGDEDDNNNDAAKLNGPGFNFYSLASNKKRLAIDVRAYAAGKIIPLGISSDYAHDFTLKAESVVLPEGGKLYLHDRLLGQYTLLQAGTAYKFKVSEDKRTQGDERFELTTSPGEITNAIKGIQIRLHPNPATEAVNISFEAVTAANTIIRLTDVSGVEVYKKELGRQRNAEHKIMLNNLASGVYLLELSNGNEKVVRQLIKQ